MWTFYSLRGFVPKSYERNIRRWTQQMESTVYLQFPKFGLNSCEKHGHLALLQKICNSTLLDWSKFKQYYLMLSFNPLLNLYCGSCKLNEDLVPFKTITEKRLLNIYSREYLDYSRKELPHLKHWYFKRLLSHPFGSHFLQQHPPFRSLSVSVLFRIWLMRQKRLEMAKSFAHRLCRLWSASVTVSSNYS